MKAHGYMIDAEWDGTTLAVTGTTKAAQVALRGQQRNDGPLLVDRAEMALVTFKEASALTNGKLIVQTRSGAKHQLHFRKKQAAEFRELADQLGAQPA